MKKNKGFIGLGLILAIIAVLAIGGGAYYFGTKNTSAPKNESINLKIKSNIESYMATVNYKPTIPGNMSACSSILYGYENNYAYAWMYCGEYDKNFKLGPASSLPIRAEFDSNYQIIEVKEARDGEGNQDYHKQIFGKFYDILFLKHPSNQEIASLEQEALNKVKSSTSSENSSTETFNNQPGAVKSITAKGNSQWTLAVDLLSRNPNWLPGVDSTGGFFINQNSKIRNLNVTTNTKTYNCGEGPDGNSTSADVLQNTSSFISAIQTDISKGDYAYKNEFIGPVRYFDINGTNITAIYQQCLP